MNRQGLISIFKISVFGTVLVITLIDLALGAEFKVATQQNLASADITTHEITSGGVVLGVSEFGGGYINKLVIPGIGDLVAKHAARYGRGGQADLRDSLHGERYNPTQAGFTDAAGTHCEIEQPSKGLLIIPSRPLSLWNGDGKYDFTEWENLANDPYPLDRGNSDSDNLDESMLVGKQYVEITSEFDFTASYEDVRDGEKVRIPAFRYYFEFRFVREPGHCLKQFGKGTPAYEPSAEIGDRSNLYPPGSHPSTENSLSGVILTSALRGDKAVWDPDTVFYVNESGNFKVTQPIKELRQTIVERARLSEYPLVIFSTSKDAGQGPAIGFFYPNTHTNQFSIVGRSAKDGSLSYEDNRKKTGTLVGNLARTPGMWLIGVRTTHTGLLSKKEVPAGMYEAIRGECYILIGTPHEIISAARSIFSLL